MEVEKDLVTPLQLLKRGGGAGDCLLEFEIKEIATLIDKNFFTFISGKHSQHNARKCADRLTQKGNSARHWHPSRLGRYYFDRVVREEV